MPKNMGTIDRAARAIFAVVVAVLYFANVISGTVAIILGVLALVFGPFRKHVVDSGIAPVLDEVVAEAEMVDESFEDGREREDADASGDR